MAEYTSRHTGLQIDEALDSALNVKQVRGIVKMTDVGPVAAVPGEDFPDSSGSTVSVTGLLKGVLNAETDEIEIQQAAAGTDYQTPLTAGVDYATPSAVVNKQNKITAQGLLKGLGDGSVAEAIADVDYATPAAVANKQNKITAAGLLKCDGDGGVIAATPGEDYQSPIPAGTYASPAISRTVTLGVAAWTGAEAPFQQTVSIQGATATNIKVVSPAPASVDEYASCGVKAAAEGAGTITFACTTAPENDLTVNIAILG